MLPSRGLLVVPRTPRTPDPVHLSLFPAHSRASTDSWASSNPDELQFDWKPDQVRLLARTLDALPPQLVTPFNGPIPPSNLLDKIARGVSHAKGPVDWPHSLRATRVKLIELSRARAKEESVDVPDATRKSRPLYKQSSMDFMSNADLRDDEGIEQVTERLTTKSNFHPYVRPRPCPASRSSRTATSTTPSSSTLNTLSSFAANRILRRTSSNVSSTSASSISVGCTHTVRKSESFYRLAPLTHKENLESSPLAGVKRGVEARRDRHVLGDKTYPSSDEEEKIRTKGAKKMRVKDAVNTPPATPPTAIAIASPKKTRTKAPLSCQSQQLPPKTRGAFTSLGKTENTISQTKDAAPSGRKPRAPAPAMSLKRNPSIFGGELPLPPHPPLAAAAAAAPYESPGPERKNKNENKNKTLRRVQRVVLGRRIEFGSLPVPGEDADVEGEGEGEDGDGVLRGRERERLGLGSAFQLR